MEACQYDYEHFGDLFDLRSFIDCCRSCRSRCDVVSPLHELLKVNNNFCYQVRCKPYCPSKSEKRQPWFDQFGKNRNLRQRSETQLHQAEQHFLPTETQLPKMLSNLSCLHSFGLICCNKCICNPRVIGQYYPDTPRCIKATKQRSTSHHGIMRSKVSVATGCFAS